MPCHGKNGRMFSKPRAAAGRVVAQLGMDVERDVRGINGEIAGDGQPQLAVEAPAMGLDIPEQAVMDEQQVGAHGHGLRDNGLAGIHRTGDAAHGTLVFKLQPIDGTRIVGDGGGLQPAVHCGKLQARN